jgi:hypothetical protein
MLIESYDEFINKRKEIEQQKKEHIKKISALNKEKLKSRLDQMNKERDKIQQKMNKNDAGSSNNG